MSQLPPRLIRVPLSQIEIAPQTDAWEAKIYPNPIALDGLGPSDQALLVAAVAGIVFSATEVRGRGARGSTYQLLTGARLFRRIAASPLAAGIELNLQIVPLTSSNFDAIVLQGLIWELVAIPAATHLSLAESAGAVRALDAARAARLAMPVNGRGIHEIADSQGISERKLVQFLKLDSAARDDE